MKFLKENRSLIIAEIAQAHDGSLGTAHAYIDAVARAGADAIKFQTHIADAESSPDEPFRVKFSRQDATRYDYWKRLEFTAEQWRGLAEHAAEQGLIFLSSPFSMAAVDLLDGLGMVAWKVASGEIGNALMLDRMCATGKPILLSTGMSGFAEIDAAVARVKRHGNPLAVFQCSTQYPCPPELVGLNLLPMFRDRYQCPVGLSDHSGTIFPGLAGVAQGMDFLELHVTSSRENFGPDVVASVTLTELAELVRGIRYIEAMRSQPLDKEARVGKYDELRWMFGKGLVAAGPLVAGQAIELKDIDARKPCNGIPAGDYEQLIGRRLKRDLRAGEFIRWEDVE